MKSILFIFCAAEAGWAGAIYTVTDLGFLGGSAAQAFGLNASGVAVGAASNGYGYTHAFSSFGNGMTDLTFNTGASDGIAAGINASGAIVGTQFINGQSVATMWKNGAPVAIGAVGSYGTAINNAGEAAGMLADGHAFAGSNELTAFSWSASYGINASGDVAGYAQTAPGVFRGFIWTPSTGYVALGTLGGTNSYAMAINDSGHVAGNAQLASGYSHAFLSSGGMMQDLGTLGGSSYAYGLDNNGNVVGYSYVNGVPHAFIFEHGVMMDVNNLIDSGAGWVLTGAYAINGWGQIAGSGLLNGVEHALRLDPIVQQDYAAAATVSTPEPATWMLAIMGLLLIVSSRIRFRPRLPLRPRDPTHELPR